VVPVYPAFARQTGVQGNVVIKATIEANGKVGQTKVVSGPEPLREAALGALRQWKYEPAQLDAQPTAAEITVTVHFNQ
jgi:protein TonB